jgi:GxxExxY protein
MPYEGEEPPYVEPDAELDELARAVIGAAIEVHRQLGPGLEESLYQGGLCVEFGLRQIPFERQVEVPVYYKAQVIGKRKLDLLVGGRLIVELKAVEVSPLHIAQLRTYLKITNLRLGLLINFNTIILKDGIKRVINPN